MLEGYGIDGVFPWEVDAVPLGKLLDRLRRRAQEDNRSIIGKIRDVQSQVRACRELAGLWDSDLDTADEIGRIDAARRRGRQVEL